MEYSLCNRAKDCKYTGLCMHRRAHQAERGIYDCRKPHECASGGVGKVVCSSTPDPLGADPDEVAVKKHKW